MLGCFSSPQKVSCTFWSEEKSVETDEKLQGVEKLRKPWRVVGLVVKVLPWVPWEVLVTELVGLDAGVLAKMRPLYHDWVQAGHFGW